MSDLRTIRFVGGPLDGDEFPLRLPATLPDPASMCRKPAGTRLWSHYVRGDDGTYRYAGGCDESTHPDGDPLPDAWDRCCCGRPGCDGTGPYPG